MWRDDHTLNRFLAKRQQHERHRLLSQPFAAWCRYVHQDCHSIYAPASQEVYTARLQRPFGAWRSLYLRQATLLPQALSRQISLSYRFRQWLLAYRVNTWQRDVSQQWERKYLSIIFHRWYALLRYNYRAKIFMEKMSRCYDTIRIRRAFMEWPGRLQSTKVLLMRRHIAEKELYGTRRRRIRLVDYDAANAENAEDPQDDDEVRSFIKVKLRNIKEHAVDLGYMENQHDSDTYEYLLKLCEVTLSCWKAYVKNELETRLKVNYLKSKKSKANIALIFRRWISLKPLVSYRTISWMNNPLHGLY